MAHAVTCSATNARKSDVGSTTSRDSLPPDASAKRKIDSTEELDPPLSSNKRAKSASQPPAFTKHSRFWALDGNVILQFGSVAFKVHRSRLSTQSVWFEKLFEKRAGREEPLDDNEKDIAVEVLDGFDLYHLDIVGTMEDFEALLTAMEDAIEFPYSPPPFATVAAIFRAAITFKFHKFEKYAKKYLLEMFSDDITTSTVRHPAAAVALGRQWNLPGILKCAFYEILRAPPAEPNDRDDDRIPNETSRRDGWTVADIVCLGETQKQLITTWLSVFNLRPAATLGPCPANTPCSAMKPNASGTIITRILQNYQLDPICGLDALIAVEWVAHGFCGSCALNQTIWLARKKKHLWERLDIWLDIPVEDERDGDDSDEGDGADD